MFRNPADTLRNARFVIHPFPTAVILAAALGLTWAMSTGHQAHILVHESATCAVGKPERGSEGRVWVPLSCEVGSSTVSTGVSSPELVISILRRNVPSIRCNVYARGGVDGCVVPD